MEEIVKKERKFKLKRGLEVILVYGGLSGGLLFWFYVIWFFSKTIKYFN